MDQEDVGAAERPGTAGCWKEPGWSWSHVQGSTRPVQPYAPSRCCREPHTDVFVKARTQERQNGSTTTPGVRSKGPRRWRKRVSGFRVKHTRRAAVDSERFFFHLCGSGSPLRAPTSLCPSGVAV